MKSQRIAGVAAALLLATSASAQMQKVGDPPEANNMRLVGYSDLQARSAYQPTIHHQGDRWIAYAGHHGGTPAIPKPVNPLTGQAEFNGTSIVDVTDPAQPKYLAHIPGAKLAITRPAAPRWCGSATARRYRRATRMRCICCARSATRRTRSGIHLIRRIQTSSPAS